MSQCNFPVVYQNYIKKNISNKAILALGKILNRPPIVELETVNLCNAKCEFCLYKQKQPEKKIEMSSSLFSKAIEQIDRNGTEQLCFVPMLGDPLLDTKIMSNLDDIASKNNIDLIRLVTNGISLDRYSDNELINMLEKLDVLQFSVAPNRHVYKVMFGVNKFDKVISNLERLSRVLPIVINKPKRVEISGRACGDEFEVDPRLTSLAKAFGMKKEINWLTEYLDWGGNIDKLPLNTNVITADNTNVRVPCKYSLDPHVYFDGKVGLCACAGADDELIIGDLVVDDWSTILNSNKRLDMIFSFLDKKPPKYCNNCSFYIEEKTIDWNDVQHTLTLKVNKK